tara:strand:+ start:5534 stop:6100 length:567 start_codon:yes stop_codon:yes gene_type:complete
VLVNPWPSKYVALKPTIYKFNISLSDLNRDHYETLNLTVARHPSETIERMIVRVLAYCINADEQLEFTKGVSAVDEPDLWLHTLDGQLGTWIDVGEPAVERIKKATRLTRDVKVYSFNSKSPIWWQQSKEKINKLNVSIFQLSCESVQALAALVQRTMSLSVTITDSSAFIATDRGEVDLTWRALLQV